MGIIEKTQAELENWLELKGKSVRKGRGFSAIEEIDFEEVKDGKIFCTKGINVNFYKFKKKPSKGYNKDNEYTAPLYFLNLD